MISEETVDKFLVYFKVVGLEKKRKRKMDVSKIIRYIEDCYSDLGRVFGKLKIFQVDFLG